LKKALFLLLSVVSLNALDLSQLNDYAFIDKGKSVDLQGHYSGVDKADFKTKSLKNIQYTEAAGSAFLAYYFNNKNAIALQTGLNYMRLDWDENPRFKEKNFKDLVVSLAYVTNSVPGWRWVMNVGTHIDTRYFNLIKNTFYTGFLWGRLAFDKSTGVHFGLLAQKGVKSTYLLPIFGIDWHWRTFHLNAVFPLDISAAYYLNQFWSVFIKGRSFGGWYKSNHRINKTPNQVGSLMSISSSGVDIGLHYKKFGLDFDVYGGYNFGGWLLIKNINKSNSQYYKYNSAPYVGANLSIIF